MTPEIEQLIQKKRDCHKVHPAPFTPEELCDCGNPECGTINVGVLIKSLSREQLEYLAIFQSIQNRKLVEQGHHLFGWVLDIIEGYDGYGYVSDVSVIYGAAAVYVDCFIRPEIKDAFLELLRKRAELHVSESLVNDEEEDVDEEEDEYTGE